MKKSAERSVVGWVPEDESVQESVNRTCHHVWEKKEDCVKFEDSAKKVRLTVKVEEM